MSAPAKLIRLTAFLGDELEDFPRYRGIDARLYRVDRFKRRELERWIETMITACVDLAKAILVLEGRALPYRYAALIMALEGVRGFSSPTLERVSRWVRLRNLLAHEYLDLRWEGIKGFLQQGEEDVRAYLAEVEAYLKRMEERL